MKIVRISFVPLILFIGVCFAGERQWKWIGPSAGSIEQIVSDRNNPKLWYVVNNGVLYRSIDEGARWIPRLGSLITEIDKTFQPVTLNPFTSEVLVLTVRPGGTRVWSSRDSGETFQLKGSLDILLKKLIPAGSHPNVLYGLGPYPWGLASSLNGGHSWESFTNLPFPIGSEAEPGSRCRVEEYVFRDLIVSPFDSNVLFASAKVLLNCGPESDEFSVFLSSSNAGKTWKILERQAFSFHTDPAFSDRVFAFNSSEIRILTKNGWKALSPIRGITLMISVPRHSNELFAMQRYFSNGFQENLLKSNDQGRTWRVVLVGLEKKLTTLQAMDNPFHGLLGGTGELGLYHRNDLHGWQPLNTGFRESVVTRLSAGNDSRLYAGASSYTFQAPTALFIKGSANSSWKITSLPGKGFFYQISVNPRNAQHIILESNTVWVSKNGGKTWTRSSVEPASCCSIVEFDPNNPGIVYAAGNSVYKSVDGGLHFSKISGSPSESLGRPLRLLIEEKNSQILFFIVERLGLFKSTNGGVSFSPAYSGIRPPCSDCESIPVVDIASLAAPGHYLAVTDSGQIYRTINGADKWELILKTGIGSVDRLWVLDETGRKLFLHTESGSLLETWDRGKTWINVAEQLGKGIVINDLTDPRKVPLYIATNHGVFVEVK